MVEKAFWKSQHIIGGKTADSKCLAQKDACMNRMEITCRRVSEVQSTVIVSTVLMSDQEED
jgi:hypothetical protein